MSKMKYRKKSERFNPDLPDALTTITAKKIIGEIKAHTEKHAKLVSADHSRWYCGISNDPNVRINGHKYKNQKEPYAWKEWNAKSRRIAEAIETYCHLTLKMKDKDTKGGSAEDSKYVYVYKKYTFILD